MQKPPAFFNSALCIGAKQVLGIQKSLCHCLIGGLLYYALLPAGADIPAPDNTGILAEAVKVGERIRSPYQQALAYTDIARATYLIAPQDHQKYLLLAYATISREVSPADRALALRFMALANSSTDPETADRWLGQALEAAHDIPSPASRALVLREIAWAFAAVDDISTAKDIFMEAARTAEEIDGLVLRVAALRDVADTAAEAVPELGMELFQSAVQLLDESPSTSAMIDLARAELATALCRHDLESALHETEKLATERLQDATRRRMAQVLAPTNPDQALMLTERISLPAERASALAAVAACLPAGQGELAAALARSALAVTGVPEEEMDILRADAAVALSLSYHEEALMVLEEMDDETLVSTAQSRIVRRHAEADPLAALAVIQELDDWTVREEAISALIPALARTDAAFALQAANEILSGRTRIRALLDIAVALHHNLEETPVNLQDTPNAQTD